MRGGGGDFGLAAGTGPAGATAADVLTEAGWSVIVLSVAVTLLALLVQAWSPVHFAKAAILDLPLLFFSSVSVFLFYGTAVWYLDKKRTPRLLHLPLVMALGIGLAFSNARAVLEALFGIKSDFVRTPKYQVEKSKDETWKRKKYKRKRGLLPLLELSFSIYFLLAILYASHMRMWGTVPFLLLFFFGFGYMGVMSFVQSFSGSRLASLWKPVTKPSIGH